MSSAIATVTNASKTYGATHALVNADFSIAPGEVRAVLGKNGAGKSTLIRILSGAERPDEGTVVLDGQELGNGGVRGANDLGVQTVYQELSLVPEMTVAENLFLGAWPRATIGIDRQQMATRAKKALELCGIGHVNPQRTIATLGIATQQMVEIARAVMREPKVLILDEPTSSLAVAEVDLVINVVKRLTARGVAVIYVSHRMAEIRKIADSGTVMRDGHMIESFTTGEKSTKEIVALMLGSVAAELAATGGRKTDRPVALSARGLVVPPKLENVDLDLHQGEILGVTGVLGSGRSELLRALAGVESIAAGVIQVNGTQVTRPTRQRMQRLGIGFTPEGRKDEGIVGPASVAENIVMSRWSTASSGTGLSASSIGHAAQSIVSKLSIKTASVHTPIENLSGGNQQKAVIGRWLYAESMIMLLDEPTRGVDVEAKAQIYELIRELADGGTSIVFVSSEVDELVAVCDRVLVLRGGTVGEEFHAPGIPLDALLTAAIQEH